MVGEVAVLRVDLVAPPEPDAPARAGRRPSSISRVSARPISSTLATPDWSSFAENFSSWRCAVRTTSGSDGSVPGMRASTIAVFFSAPTALSTTIWTRSPFAASVAPPPPQRRGLSPRMRSERACPTRRETTNANVVFSPFGPSSAGLEPGDLVGRLGERVQARGAVRQDSRGAALPDRLLHDGRDAAGGEDDVAAHVPALVVGRLLSGAHVDERRRHVRAPGVVRDRRSRPRRRSRASCASPSRPRPR
jgi:hypothetical protein